MKSKLSVRWLIMNNRNLVLVNTDNSLLNDIEILSITSIFLRQFYLGSLNGTKYYCAEIDVNSEYSDKLKSITLRQLLAIIHIDLFSIVVKGYSVINWDKNHKFCGRCGLETVFKEQNFQRECYACKLSFFPRISPSIIVLIHKENEILMARSPHFAPGVYGLIAGFIEVGETAEEAVCREVMEEVGIQVKNISYFGSQPWPFPDTLMLAFTAEYNSGDIHIDNKEIEAAGWYRYDGLPGRPSMAISIATSLLDSFIGLRNTVSKR